MYFLKKIKMANASVYFNKYERSSERPCIKKTQQPK